MMKKKTAAAGTATASRNAAEKQSLKPTTIAGNPQAMATMGGGLLDADTIADAAILGASIERAATRWLNSHGKLSRFGPWGADMTRLDILATLDRDKLETFIEVALDLLDAADPDPDLEEHGLEDSFCEHEGLNCDGPGCSVADAGGPSWRERLDQSDTPYGQHQYQGTATLAAPEDAEDDDPLELNGDELDGTRAEDEPLIDRYGLDRGPGCPIADPDYAVDDQPCDDVHGEGI
jgi:hypothetical protein